MKTILGVISKELFFIWRGFLLLAKDMWPFFVIGIAVFILVYSVKLFILLMAIALLFVFRTAGKDGA